MFNGVDRDHFFQRSREKSKIKNKALIFSTILICIPIILYFLIIHQNTLEMVKQDKIRTSEQVLRQTSRTIRYSLSDLYETTNRITRHNGIRKAVQDYGTLKDSLKKNISNFIELQFQEAKEKNPHIKQLFAITQQGEVFSYEGEYAIEGEKFLKSSYYSQINVENEEVLWIYEKNPSFFKTQEEEQIFFTIQKIKAINEDKNVGYLVSVLNIENFSELYQDILKGLSEELVIYDEKSNNFVTSSQYPIDPQIMNKLIKENSLDKIKELKIQGRPYAIGVIPLTPLDWYIASILPTDEITKSTQKILMENVWLYSILGILVIAWIIIQMIIFSKIEAKRQKKEGQDHIEKSKNKEMMDHKEMDIGHIKNIEILIERKDLVKTTEYINQWKDELLEKKEDDMEDQVYEIEDQIYEIEEQK